MLQFQNFTKSYGNYPALKIENLNLETGIYWIKGINGSGKSTLLKSIAGILAFDGDIMLEERISIKKQPVAYRKLVNFAEAEPVFPDFLTGTEMVRLFADAKDAPAGQEDRYIKSMGMQSFVDRPVGTYSSGMMKKLSLLLAFLGKPKLILLDEPLITIDTASLATLNSWIRERYEQEGTGFLLSSHQILEDGSLPVSGELLVEDQTLKFIS
ncbi:ABC transporter ATP-binding protein [Mucilaginibacter rubeus]|uniref:ABC transporter ATP-binding protein n=1 Tax=Mucilaginibacter rubeus TaxID=2027860 RepID=A0AAE6JDY7_9SPHI|nr:MULTISPECIES: ABC transporter ATP-binding protein [Mucilaginibacter]QEM03969.1 ABC transporter ATP-binding protein [Mucilaginibacter rubeus]QEM16577.1 ABC transporter ATP-binding protein [Mucilaginibacter gossypii]QTE40648.1 ABC transporter ATP-binding protein [Mucilaginibacter rubeus]QTE47250.1 ABC transporter ATP-binding protein [Mucilaginibacter rubeus]QTE58643.1 ABC transporter ATP-binding protein [Mucilaginibacter rubeus]